MSETIDPSGEEQLAAGDRFLEVFMDQNNLCNLACTMCAFSDPRVQELGKHQMPMWLFEKIAREVFPHAHYLALSCLTEPLMSKDFPERLDVLRKHPVPFVEMVTNGQILNERILRKIVEVPLQRVAVSIDGATAETYEKIRVRASFERLLEHLELFRNIRHEAGSEEPILRINHVLSQGNVDEFPQFLELVERLEARELDVRTILPFRNAADQGTVQAEFWERMREYRDRLTTFCARTGIRDVGYLRPQHEEIVLLDDEGEKRYCRRPWNTAAIHFNGDVQICMTWMRDPVGNIAKQSFEEIWTGAPLRRLRDEFFRERPGLDCQHCTIKMDRPTDEEDGFFSMLAKSPAPSHLE